MTVYSLELILHVMNESVNLCKLGSGRWYNPRNKEKNAFASHNFSMILKCAKIHTINRFLTVTVRKVRMRRSTKNKQAEKEK